MLKITNFSLTTREPILIDTNFNFQLANCYQLTAENGAGKSSFLRAIVDLIPYKGHVTYNSSSYSKNKAEVFFFESNSWLNKDLNSYDYLELVKKEWHSAVDLDQVMNYWGMNEYAKIPIKKYSLGMKQRLIIAMYFVSDAKYWLMDEVTNGLDAENRKKFYQKINEEVSKDKCIIITTHYSDEIAVEKLHKLTLKNHKLVEVR